jgi:hypothetical protein
VPPANGRTVPSRAWRSAIASASERGSANSNGLRTGPPRRHFMRARLALARELASLLEQPAVLREKMQRFPGR